MTFPELRARIDERIATDARLQGAACELHGDASQWTLNAQSVAFRADGSTGILAEYRSAGELVHSRIFAASPMSIARIVTTAAEHLTAYALHRM
jgi:hypothetical protein